MSPNLGHGGIAAHQRPQTWLLHQTVDGRLRVAYGRYHKDFVPLEPGEGPHFGCIFYADRVQNRDGVWRVLLDRDGDGMVVPGESDRKKLALFIERLGSA